MAAAITEWNAPRRPAATKVGDAALPDRAGMTAALLRRVTLRRPAAPVASLVEVPPGVELLPLSLLESGLLPLAKAVERELMAVAGDVDVRQGRLGAKEGHDDRHTFSVGD